MSYNNNVRFPPGFGYLRQEEEGADGHHLEHDEEVDGHRGGERDLEYQGAAKGSYQGALLGFGALGQGRGEPRGGGSIGGFPGYLPEEGYQGREGGSGVSHGFGALRGGSGHHGGGNHVSGHFH